MEEQLEREELRSGTWIRDLMAGAWRLGAARVGTMVGSRHPAQDGPSATAGAPQGAAAPAPDPEATVAPPVKQEPGSAGSVPAAEPRPTEALSDYLHSYAGEVRLFDAPAATEPVKPGMRRQVGWKPILTAAAVLAFAAIVAQQLAVTGSDRSGAQGARRAPAAATVAVTAPKPPSPEPVPGTSQAPRAEPAPPRAEVVPPRQPQAPAPAPAPPAPNRLLCSAANEAAGLCNAR